MRRASKVKSRMRVERSGKSLQAGVFEREQTKTDDVRYFLDALHQISDALHALGYPAEGNALAEVRVDLRRRLFGASEQSVRALESFH